MKAVRSVSGIARAAFFVSLICLASYVMSAPARAAVDTSYSIETVEIVEQPGVFDYPGENVSPVVHDRMVYEKNLEIKTRDGTIIRANVFRPPVDGERFPSLIALTPYVKDVRLEGAVLEEIEQAGNYLTHELPNPDFWVARGYAVVWVDTRGTGASDGKADLFSSQEARDYHDAIEWVAEQPWSDGKVASTAISYMAIVQWAMASQQPPHLAAMIPWEGANDNYRTSHHGGIPSTGFIGGWFGRVSSRQQPEHPQGLTGDNRFVMWGPAALGTDLDGPFFDDRTGDHSKITVPLLSAGNWGGTGLHHPGNIDGFVQASSDHKILTMHEGTHIGPYFSAKGTLLQLRFLDHWLKDMDSGIQDEPPVRLAIMSGYNDSTERLESEWPLSQTEWTRLYLNPTPSSAVESGQHDGTLTHDAPSAEQAITYSADPMGKTFGGRGGPGARFVVDKTMWPYNWTDAVTFVTEPMAEDTEITGPVKLAMWVSSSVDDMEIFATVRNIDPDGNEVMIFGTAGPDASASRGWLRVSLRKLDSDCSTEYQPCHAFDEKQMLAPGDVVPVEVRINPMGMVFKQGHRLMLDIQTGDSPGGRPNFTYNNTAHRVGDNTIYTGGDRASYLLLPVIPGK